MTDKKSPQITIRRATITDAKEIAHIHVDSWRATYRGIVSDEYLAGLSYEARVVRWTEEGKGHLTLPDPVAVFVVEDKNKMLGFADVGPARDSSNPKHAEICAIYLEPDCIGRGIGAALFNACMSHIKKHGFEKLTIVVMSKNTRARKFYERMGGIAIASSEVLEKFGNVEEELITYEWPPLNNKKSPQRKCLVSGESFDKENLLRFVRAPDGTLTFDVNGKLPGRGAYVTPTADVLTAALKKNLFNKSFKDGTKVPADMAAQVLQQIRHAALQYLALARRAGQAVAGAEKCTDFIRRHNVGGIIQASDAGRDGQQTARGLAGDQPIVTEFTRDELGAIFGREQAVVVALAQSGVAKRFFQALERLNALKGLEIH